MRTRSWCLAIIPVLAELAAAQQANYSMFGQGCGVIGEPPFPAALWVQGRPALGATFTVGFTAPTYSSTSYQLFSFLVTGVSRSFLNGIQLPIHLTGLFIGGPNCMLYCSVESLTFVNRLSFIVPNDMRLVGRELYQQWYLWYRLRPPTGLQDWYITSDGGIARFGF